MTVKCYSAFRVLDGFNEGLI